MSAVSATTPSPFGERIDKVVMQQRNCWNPEEASRHAEAAPGSAQVIEHKITAAEKDVLKQELEATVGMQLDHPHVVRTFKHTTRVMSRVRDAVCVSLSGVPTASLTLLPQASKPCARVCSALDSSAHLVSSCVLLRCHMLGHTLHRVLHISARI